MRFFSETRFPRLPSLLAICLFFSVIPVPGNDAPVSVTITKKAPILTLSVTGDVSGVSESTVGTKMTFVSLAGPQVTLRDAGGVTYRIALSATDYQPPAAAPTAIAAPPVKPSLPPVVPKPAAPAPPAPTTVASIFGAPPSASDPVTDAAVVTPPTEDSITTVTIGQRLVANQMCVWPEGGTPGRPLLIAAHGNGGSGRGEIRGWLVLAQTHKFTIVCPSFLSSVNDSHLGEDEPDFNQALKWIKDNLKFDRANVFMVGFSGGGFPTWYLATKHPDFFRGLAFQSGNFAGYYYDFSLAHWYDRPIKLIWGTQDMTDIPNQNEAAVAALKAEHCHNYTTEIVEGGTHQEHPDKVVAWMEQNLAPADNGL